MSSNGRRVRRAVSTAAVAVTVFALGASTARADGLHMRPRFWLGGCTATYSLDQRATAEYAANVGASLTAISRYTGMSFTRVPSAGAASFRFVVSDDFDGDELGLANGMGDVELADISELPSAHDDAIDGQLRDRIVTHEMLHALGLDHDAEEWSLAPDEVMNPRQAWKPLQFGNGDRAGMAYLRSVNHCIVNATTTSGHSVESGYRWIFTSSQAVSALGVHKHIESEQSSN